MNFDLRILLVGTQVDLRPDGKKKAKPAAAAAAPKIVIPEELKKASDHPKFCLSQMPSNVLLQILSYGFVRTHQSCCLLLTRNNSYLSLPDLYASMRVSKRWQKIANGRYVRFKTIAGGVTAKLVIHFCF